MEKNADLKFNISATANQSITSNIRFSTQDEGSAKLTFFLFKDGVELPLNAVVGKLVMRMRDGSKFTDNVSIIDKVNGIAEYKLTAEQLKHYGKVTAELYLYYEEQKLSVHRFTFTILQALIDEDIPVLTEFYIDDFEELKTTINFMADETTEIINTVGINVEEAKRKADEAITLIEQNQVVKLTEFNENKQQVNTQLVGTANLIGFNFEQQGGVPNDDSLKTAQANTKLFRDLMYTCYVMGGGTVSIPNGTFYFAKYDEVEIVMAYSNVNVKGVGMEKSILKIIEEESSAGGYSFFRNLSSLNNANYSDFTIDMYAQTMHHYGPGGKAFYIQKLTDCTFKNLKLKGTPSTALGIDHLVNVHIDNVHCYECGRLWGYVLETEGILPFVPTNPKSHNTYPGGAGIGIGTGNIDGENFKITNCTAELCGHYGIFVEHQRLYSSSALKESKDIIIANNICRNNRFAGIGIRGGTRISLVGNESYGNGCYGLSIDSKGILDPIVTLKESIIIGNIFNENGLDGIHIDGYCNVDGLDIKNNDLLNNTHYGLGLGHYNYSDFTNTIQRNIVFAGNTMYGNKDGDIYKDSNRMIAYVNLIIENNYILTTDPPAENVFDDTDSKIAYFGDGWQTVSSKACFGGTSHYANTAHGSTFCKFVFSGTGFKLYSPTSRDKGKAAVSVDYGKPFIVDLYTEDALPTHIVAEINGLTRARHTVTIDYLASKNSVSSGDGINIDAVVIIDGELLDSNADNKVRVEDGNEKITLEGVWSKSSGDMYSNGICRFTNTTGSYAQFNFTGTQIDVRVPTGPDKGKMKITLNGVETIVDEYTPTIEYNKVVFTANNLDPNATHTIKIEFTGEKNAASSNSRVTIDSFIIYNGDIV